MRHTVTRDRTDGRTALACVTVSVPRCNRKGANKNQGRDKRTNFRRAWIRMREGCIVRGQEGARGPRAGDNQGTTMDG